MNNARNIPIGSFKFRQVLNAVTRSFCNSVHFKNGLFQVIQQIKSSFSVFKMERNLFKWNLFTVSICYFCQYITWHKSCKHNLQCILVFFSNLVCNLTSDIQILPSIKKDFRLETWKNQNLKYSVFEFKSWSTMSRTCAKAKSNIKIQYCILHTSFQYNLTNLFRAW